MTFTMDQLERLARMFVEKQMETSAAEGTRDLAQAALVRANEARSRQKSDKGIDDSPLAVAKLASFAEVCREDMANAEEALATAGEAEQAALLNFRTAFEANNPEDPYKSVEQMVREIVGRRRNPKRR
jgi:hypothetical protein